MLGDERRAREGVDANGKQKDTETRLNDYEKQCERIASLRWHCAIKGLTENSVHFSYRAQQLARSALYLQGKTGAFIFSFFLDLLAGYGYKPARSAIAYLCVIVLFTLAYYFLGQEVDPAFPRWGHLSLALPRFMVEVFSGENCSG